MADCRKCVHRRPYHEMSLAEIERCKSLARARGQECLGWCTKYNRGITYWRGPCRGYENRDIARPPRVTLADFYPGLREV